MSLRCLLGLQRPSLTAITRRHDARPSWQSTIGIMAIPLALSLAGCDASAGKSVGGRTSAPAAGERFACTPTRVYDGDGPIWCAEGPRVRLAGIAAREIDGSCRRNHPCPATTGTAARAHLVRLIGRRSGVAPTGHVLVEGPSLTCVSAGSAGGSRTAAWCVSPVQGDLSCAMVRSGYALRWDRYWRGHRC